MTTRGPTRLRKKEHEERTGARVQIGVTGCGPALARQVRRAARTALAAGGVRTGRLDVSFVGAVAMRSVHRRWMNDGSVTDVLTFDLRIGGARDTVDGQVVICRDVARREAARRGIAFAAEALLYVVHACLHLTGYDDRGHARYELMHRREDALMTRLGLLSVFARTPRERRAQRRRGDRTKSSRVLIRPLGRPSAATRPAR
jgi:probable rRNA maturation factor